MLDSLTSRLAGVVKTLRGQARLTEANIREALREVRVALLEADVALPVVKEFIARVREKAVGEEVIGSLTPGQALVGVVQRELAELMGSRNDALNLAVVPPAVILLAGLQGSGRPRPPANWRNCSANRGRKHCWRVATSIDPPQSNSLQPWPVSSAWKCLRPTLRKNPRRLPPGRSTTRASIITTC